MSSFDLGFLGGGQLARMSIQAAQRMGLRCQSLDPGEDTPASQIAPSVVGRLDDPTKIAEILGSCDRVTLENEFIPAHAIREALMLAGRDASAIVPGVETLATIQDKLLQREALLAAGVPSPRAFALDDGGVRAREEIGFPMVLKARFGGYDGKGTRYARTPDEFESHRAVWEAGGWLAEEFVPFRREIATMVWVSADGAARGAFPTMETVQENHVCSLVYPADVDASEIALAAVQAVEGRGLFGVEMFELENGRILINELAPRPHNTGHYTLDWGGLSQFDVHVRVVSELDVEDKLEGAPVCMANLLGQPGATDFLRALGALLSEHPETRFHWYGKVEAKPGRKMGHLNVVGADTRQLIDKVLAARACFYAHWTGR